MPKDLNDITNAEKRGQQVESEQVGAVRTDRGSVPPSLAQHVLGLVLSNSFLMRVTGQLSHRMWRERRGGKTHFLITDRYLHVPHLHTVCLRGEKGHQQRVFFFFF